MEIGKVIEFYDGVNIIEGQIYDINYKNCYYDIIALNERNVPIELLIRYGLKIIGETKDMEEKY